MNLCIHVLVIFVLQFLFYFYSDMDGEKFRVTYTIYEYQDLLDSTNMQIDDWIRIAQDVKVCINIIFFWFISYIFT